MKVVLFCGGRGMRLREYSESVPKPLVPVGKRPILWHIMKYYASFGHTDFVVCLGYQGDLIKQYFMDYQEYLSNDFVLERDGTVNLLSRDTQGWRITFVDTGLESNIGGRLLKVKEHVQDEQFFLANYGDTLTDFNLSDMTEPFIKSNDKVASFLCVRPPYSFHLVALDDESTVLDIEDVSQSDVWMNGGYFILRNDIFNYLEEGEELVVESFEKLQNKRLLCGQKHEGFWACMDTFKEKQELDRLEQQGNAPWQVWQRT